MIFRYKEKRIKHDKIIYKQKLSLSNSCETVEFLCKQNIYFFNKLQQMISIKTEKIIKIVNSCETSQQFENIKKFLNESEFETVGDCKILRETLIQKQKQFNTIQDEKN